MTPGALGAIGPAATFAARRETMCDGLTGLLDRAGFAEQLKRLVDAGAPAFAVVIVDLERFSRINECLGAPSGDELLIAVARRMRGALRVDDALARTGGDEFGVLLTIESSKDEASQVATRIRGALAEPFRLSEGEVRVGCAIGLAFGDELCGDAEEVIRQAQFAMKRAKVSGQAEAYQAAALATSREHFAMETALRHALDADQLTLAFQPICDLATGRIVSFEALARWTDQDGVVHPPDTFIPIAEASGLIVSLGRWALNSALSTLVAWDAAWGGDCGVAVAVNVSAIQFQRDSMLPLVERCLAKHGLAPHRLKLELTESAIVHDSESMARTLHALKALGVGLAMDDFGTGYSNLSNLQRLPIDLLKLDRSFVTMMMADADKLALTRAVISLAQALGMATVAEGIETPELGETLAQLGCTYGQGYFYARPLPPDAAFAVLRERNA